MKTKFILQKSNVGEFIKRFNRLIGVTGALKSKGEYKGRKAVYKALKGFGIKDPFILPVLNTTDGYILDELVTFEINLESLNGKKGCLIIRPNSSSAYIIEFGTKIRFTPTHISWNTINHFGDGYTTTLSQHSNVENAKQRLKYEDEMDRQYWEDQMDQDFFGDNEEFGKPNEMDQDSYGDEEVTDFIQH